MKQRYGPYSSRLHLQKFDRGEPESFFSTPALTMAILYIEKRPNLTDLLGKSNSKK